MRIFFLFPLLIIPMPLYAADYYYCAHKLDYVHLGYTLDQVQKICGEPHAKSSRIIHPVLAREVERWTYHFQPNASLITGKYVARHSALMIDFYKDKAIRILVEGRPQKFSHYCRPDIPIKLGDSPFTVYGICQYPSVKETVEQRIPLAPERQVIWTYQENQVVPSTHLYFQDNKLVKIE